HDAVAAADEDDGARQLPVGDGLLDERRDRVETRQVEPRLRARGGRYGLRRPRLRLWHGGRVGRAELRDERNAEKAARRNAHDRWITLLPPALPAPSHLAAAAVVAIAAAGSTLACRGGAPFDRRADQNVLLITIDTLRTDGLSSYGGLSRTPNL